MSQRSRPSRYLGLRGIVGAAILTGLMILAGAGGLMLFAASRLDAVQADQEAALAARRLDRLQARMVEAVTSATVWNDAVEAIRRDDKAWMQSNFGDYYADYMEHQSTLVLDGDARLISASFESETVGAAEAAGLLEASQPLIARVAAEAATPARRSARGLDAAVGEAALLRVGDQIYQVAAVTVVPEDAKVERLAHDPIVISARPLSEFLESLSTDLSLTAPVYQPMTGPGAGRLALRGLDGAPLGQVRWTPAKPGLEVMRQSLPVFGLFLFLLGVAAVVLMRRMDAIALRLSLSEAALVEARERAEAASEAKTRFLSNISHELRTPLNGVMGMAEVMGLGPLSPQQQGHLKILKASGGDLLRLIEHLLAVTRLERGVEATQAVEPIDVAGLIASTVARHRGQAEAKGLSLSASAAVEGLRLGAGATLEQALGYLVDNALTYTHSGGVRVLAMEDGDRVSIIVSDTGIGIDPSVLPRLFDPFVQADDSTTRRFDGAGLGLSICHGLIAAMGGSIHVDSQIGQGSRFTLDLPLPRVEAIKVAEPLAA